MGKVTPVESYVRPFVLLRLTLDDVVVDTGVSDLAITGSTHSALALPAREPPVEGEVRAEGGRNAADDEERGHVSALLRTSASPWRLALKRTARGRKGLRLPTSGGRSHLPLSGTAARMSEHHDSRPAN